MQQWSGSVIFHNNVIERDGARCGAQVSARGREPFLHAIYSYENTHPRDCFLPRQRIEGAEFEADLNILILRDPFNWLASVMQADRSFGGGRFLVPGIRTVLAGEGE